MSSFTRRIQRQRSPSQAVHPTIIIDDEGNSKQIGWHSNPPREKFYMNRGYFLGVHREHESA